MPTGFLILVVIIAVGLIILAIGFMTSQDYKCCYCSEKSLILFYEQKTKICCPKCKKVKEK